MLVLEMTTFGEWMRNRRIELRLKAYEAADRAGMKPQAWSDLENDRSRKADGSPMTPRPDTLRRIARALEVPARDAIEAAGVVSEADSQYDPQADSDFSEDDPAGDDMQRLLAFYEGIGQDDKDELLQIARMKWEKRHGKRKTE